MSFIAKLITWLGRVFQWHQFEHEVTPMPSTDHTITEVPIVVTPIDKVRLCALAQQEFEGWSPGSNSYRHNNPGNCKDIHGQFIPFPTYEAGFAYLQDYIRRVATGKHKAYPKGGKTTIREYTHIYTSDAEPAPTNYATHIAKAVGLSTDAPMSALLQS